MAEMRMWLRRSVSVSSVTLEDESAPGVSPTPLHWVPYAKC